MNSSVWFLLLVPFGASLMGCSSETTADATDPSSQRAAACALAEPGPDFTFQLRNEGAREVHLNLGWGAATPIRVETPDGRRGISPWQAEGECGESCETVYAQGNTGCALGGPGDGIVIPAGESTTIRWDRRYFELDDDPSACAAPQATQAAFACALPRRAEPSTTTRGVLTVCDPEPDEIASGFCRGETFEVPFDLDLSTDEAVIAIDPGG